MGSASSAGGGPLGEYPLVVQHADDGMRRLTFSTAVPLTCALSDPYEPDIFEGCDRYLLTAMIPEALLVTGAVLEDQVGGVGIIEASAGMADPPSSSSCPLSAGPPPIGAKLELVDVSDTVTARLTGFNGSSIFYTGQVDGEYTGALCSPGPGPQPGAGTARVWGSGTISLVVSSEAIDCTPDPAAPTACETWQLEFTFPESMLVPGPLDLHHPSVDSYAVGHGKLHENPSSPTDCSGTSPSTTSRTTSASSPWMASTSPRGALERAWVAGVASRGATPRSRPRAHRRHLHRRRRDQR